MTCPACNRRIVSQMGASGQPLAATEETLNICNACGCLTVLEDGQLRPANDAEVNAAWESPEARQALLEVAMGMRRARHLRS